MQLIFIVLSKLLLVYDVRGRDLQPLIRHGPLKIHLLASQNWRLRNWSSFPTVWQGVSSFEFRAISVFQCGRVTETVIRSDSSLPIRANNQGTVCHKTTFLCHKVETSFDHHQHTDTPTHSDTQTHTNTNRHTQHTNTPTHAYTRLHTPTHQHTPTHTGTHRHTLTHSRHTPTTPTHTNTHQHTPTHTNTHRHTQTHRHTTRLTRTHRDTHRHTLTHTETQQQTVTDTYRRTPTHTHTHTTQTTTGGQN
jgi:hypothetical protein